jgi:hypothetical protein
LKKHFRILFLLCLFLFLTAQECVSPIAGVGDIDLNDCSDVELDPIILHTDGSVVVTWTDVVPSSTRIVVGPSSDTIYFDQTYQAGVNAVNFRLDWQNIPTDFLWLYFVTGNCSIQRILERPTAATATPVAAPRATASAIPNIAAVSMNCANLRLTSPLGGMSNGMQTFYWDALPNAVGYRINIYYAGNYLTGWNAPTGQLNLTADVSRAAIGGETPLTVELVALDGRGGSCTQRYDMGREASPAQQGAAPTTTCVPNPNPTGPRCI